MPRKQTLPEIGIPMAEAEEILGLTSNSIVKLIDAGTIKAKSTSDENSARKRRYPILTSVMAYKKVLVEERKAELAAARDAEKARKEHDRLHSHKRLARVEKQAAEVAITHARGKVSVDPQKYIYNQFYQMRKEFTETMASLRDGGPVDTSGTVSTRVDDLLDQLAKTNDAVLALDKKVEQVLNRLHTHTQRLDHIDTKFEEARKLTERLLLIMQEVAKDELDVDVRDGNRKGKK